MRSYKQLSMQMSKQKSKTNDTANTAFPASALEFDDAGISDVSIISNTNGNSNTQGSHKSKSVTSKTTALSSIGALSNKNLIVNKRQQQLQHQHHHHRHQQQRQQGKKQISIMNGMSSTAVWLDSKNVSTEYTKKKNGIKIRNNNNNRNSINNKNNNNNIDIDICFDATTTSSAAGKISIDATSKSSTLLIDQYQNQDNNLFEVFNDDDDVINDNDDNNMDDNNDATASAVMEPVTFTTPTPTTSNDNGDSESDGHDEIDGNGDDNDSDRDGNENNIDIDTNNNVINIQDQYFPSDCYSFLGLYGPLHHPWYFSFGMMPFVFQVILSILLILSVVCPKLGTHEDVDNPDSDDGFFAAFIPANVAPIVKATQITSILVYVIFADSSLQDVASAVNLFPRFSQVKRVDKARRLVFSSILRATQGILATSAVLLLVVTSSTVIDIILNFTA